MRWCARRSSVVRSNLLVVASAVGLMACSSTVAPGGHLTGSGERPIATPSAIAATTPSPSPSAGAASLPLGWRWFGTSRGYTIGVPPGWFTSSPSAAEDDIGNTDPPVTAGGLEPGNLVLAIRFSEGQCRPTTPTTGSHTVLIAETPVVFDPPGSPFPGGLWWAMGLYQDGSRCVSFLEAASDSSAWSAAQPTLDQAVATYRSQR